MGWVSLTLRKQSLRENISSLELRDIQISRTLRAVHRQMSYDQSIMNNDKSTELKAIKDEYNEVRNDRPETGSAEYNEWMQEYQIAKETYEEEKYEIMEYYDDQMRMLEEEAADKEATLQEEQTVVEAQLEAMRAEFDVIRDQISEDIKNSTIKIN